MKEAGLSRASPSEANGPEAANDDAFLDPVLPVPPGRHTAANDNPRNHDLPPCLPVTDEEITLLHRYLSREILGLFS